MAADADGTPLFLSVETFRKLSGESIDPEECCITINKRAFETIYALYAEWHTASPDGCSLAQLCGAQGNYILS